MFLEIHFDQDDKVHVYEIIIIDAMYLIAFAKRLQLHHDMVDPISIP